jgi:hypothetical protein
MKNEDGFYFIPKKWLGDANVIAMDWDCKGMYLHLMAIAWQQPQKGFILDDDNLIKKLLGNPEETDWLNRIKPQIFSAWKQKMVLIDGVNRLYWYQPGIIKATLEAEREKPIKKIRTTRFKKNELIIENPEFDGFDLKILLDSKVTTTILHEVATVEEKSTIWTLGVQLVKKHGDSDAKARGFIAKLIKQYGDKPVAEAIAQLSLKSIPPAEVHSYLSGILKKQEENIALSKKGTGKGRVSI